MSDFADTYKRSLDRVERLDMGEWTDATASGLPVLRCPACGGLTELSADHRIIEGGLVVPAVKCATATCVAFAYVRLADWGEVIR
jgi:hypothetical protein